MATVRREGDWRLEKRREGVYEITHQKEPKMKVLTPDHSKGEGQQALFETLPVREVSSFSEAKGLFEEKAHGPPPVGMDFSTNQTENEPGLPKEGDFGEGMDLSEVPPGVLGAALLIAGSFILYTFRRMSNPFGLLIGIGFVGMGLLIFAYGGYLFKTEGWREGWNFLIDEREGTNSGSSGDSDTEKTPPAPESLKNELFFERANRHCEYCGNEIDHPEVHHITPRSEGGENKPENLIVLCPNCHRKADRGAISKSKLKYQI